MPDNTEASADGLRASGNELANRTIIEAFAARSVTLRTRESSPLEPKRLPKHVRYRCATPRRVRAWIEYTARLDHDTEGPAALQRALRRPPGSYLPRSHRSRSARSITPSTRTTRSLSITSYITRCSPTRSRWKVSAVPRIDLTDLPDTRPGLATSCASRSRAVRMRFRSASPSFLNCRAAERESRTS